mgnify:CR=1 FL=1
MKFINYISIIAMPLIILIIIFEAINEKKNFTHSQKAE